MAESLHEQYRAEMTKFSAIVHGMDPSAARRAIDARERSVMKQASSYGLDRIDVPNVYAVLMNSSHAKLGKLSTGRIYVALALPLYTIGCSVHRPIIFLSGCPKLDTVRLY
jgi:hypothetical protein